MKKYANDYYCSTVVPFIAFVLSIVLFFSANKMLYTGMQTFIEDMNEEIQTMYVENKMSAIKNFATVSQVNVMKMNMSLGRVGTSNIISATETLSKCSYRAKDIIITDVTEYPVEEMIVEETEPADPYFGYTEEDYEYLLMCIVGEVGNCSKEQQLYCGSVVLNRLNSPYYKNCTCIKDICLMPKQYTCFANGMAYREATDLNREVVMELLEFGSVLPENVIFQSSVVQGDGIYCQLDNVIYCYKN